MRGVRAVPVSVVDEMRWGAVGLRQPMSAASPRAFGAPRRCLGLALASAVTLLAPNVTARAADLRPLAGPGSLARELAALRGRVVVLTGNHEQLNLVGELRPEYVSADICAGIPASRNFCS